MTNSWRIGGVTLELREDGNFSIYQPDAGRVLPREMAVEVACAILNAYPDFDPAAAELLRYPSIEVEVPIGVVVLPGDTITVPGGVIGTSEGPQYTASEYREEGPALPKPTDMELEADANAELGRKQAAPKPPVKRRPGRPRKAQP